MTASTEKLAPQEEENEPQAEQESLEEPATGVAEEELPADDRDAAEAEEGEEVEEGNGAEPPASAQELKSERVQ